MREFAQIKMGLWSRSRKFRSLPDAESRLFYFYLHTCDHVNSIGAFRLPKGYAYTDLAAHGWKNEAVDRAMESLLKADLIGWDAEAEVIRIVDFLAQFPTTNPKHAAGAVKLALALPDSKEKRFVCADLAADPHGRAIDAVHVFLATPPPVSETPSHSPIETQDTDTEPDTESETETETEGTASLRDDSSPDPNLPLNGELIEADRYKAQPVADKALLDEAVTAWNVMAADNGLAQVQKLTPAREASLRRRLKDCGGINGWDDMLSKVSESSFLLGQSGDRNWRATFDFVIKESKFAAIMEGTYDDPPDDKGLGGDRLGAAFDILSEDYESPI